jgi:hypothetical protein
VRRVRRQRTQQQAATPMIPPPSPDSPASPARSGSSEGGADQARLPRPRAPWSRGLRAPLSRRLLPVQRPARPAAWLLSPRL